ncbi:class I SAM-dependent methyltransferase [Occultella kanbiaonis]|uniref:class I SAM-dependent methyltransferase n=1 Tax=Occultella kanbiaonis TaxID=2675754 RepID=UPI0013D00560|nr:class I SAM-dependent methyltransferase [Occultella kanbiaonis]
MLAVARGWTEQVEWREGTAEDIPFPDGAFDLVASQFALMYFTGRARGLAEMARVLVPGGRVVVAAWAAVEECPGYTALIDVVGRTIGSGAADALLAPFSIGGTDALTDLLTGPFFGIDVHQHPGTARFDSIDAWVHTEVRGWTLADTIDDEQYDRLLAVARADLAPFSDSRGRVEFSMPALIGTGLRR